MPQGVKVQIFHRLPGGYSLAVERLAVNQQASVQLGIITPDLMAE